MRIGLLGCSSEEGAAVSGHLDDELVTIQAGHAVGPEFDFALLGFSCAGDVSQILRERVQVPAILLIPAAADYEAISDDVSALALSEIQRLRSAIRRERRIFANLTDPALEESEQRYRTLVEQAQDIVFSFDTAGRILSLNRAFEKITGWSREEWLGRPFIEIIDVSSRERASRRFTKIVAGAAPAYAEYVVRTRTGPVITLECTSQAILRDGHTYAVVGVGRDVTKRKLAEAQAEKEKRLASLGQLATSVAHDFNNVLMSIMPFAEVLQRRFRDDERVTAPTNHIIQAVRRGREISQEILRFARPVPPIIAPLSIAEWIAAFEKKAAAMLGTRYVVRTDIDSSIAHASILADRSLIDQVATNLAVNARDAMPSGGTLTISAEPSVDPNAIDIAITDTGGGISEDMLDRIFEPLFTTKRGGSGLGLSIADQAMREQNASLRVRSMVGEGSTFTMTFPTAPERHAETESPKINRPKRLLIVEDDVSVGEGLQLLLAGEGFDVHWITRGLDAPNAVAELRPDLVLLDVNLPDVNGLDLYERLHETWPALRVIFSTGHADARALMNVRDRKVPSIMKPYQIEELLAIIAAD